MQLDSSPREPAIPQGPSAMKAATGWEPRKDAEQESGRVNSYLRKITGSDVKAGLRRKALDEVWKT